MANIHDDAWRGSLTADRLKLYVTYDSYIINRADGPKNVTPLAAACIRGHINVVKVLLDNPHCLAEVDALSPPNRTPLYYATTRTPPLNRLAIVRELIKAGANVDACSPEDGMYTPLMNAIVEIQDKEVIHELVDAGASQTLQNDQGQTAVDLATDAGMEKDLRPRSERNSIWAEIVNAVIAVVMLIIAYVNSPSLTGAVSDAAKKVYDITGAKDQKLVTEIPQPKTVEEFKDNVSTYVKDSGLEKFFKRDDPFLQTLAEKASALRDDPNSLYNKPENMKRLTRLALYRPIIYCDDSGSMNTGDRLRDQRELVSRIARIATKIVPDSFGVELSFINNPNTFSNLSAPQIDDAMNSVHAGGGTRLGTNLRRKILEPLVYNTVESGKDIERPLLVCTITDGCPTNEDEKEFKNAITECRRKLVAGGYEPTSAMFSISQIGDDHAAGSFLSSLRGDPEVEDILFCTADQLDEKFRELKENEKGLEEWLLKTLTAPLMGGTI